MTTPEPVPRDVGDGAAATSPRRRIGVWSLVAAAIAFGVVMWVDTGEYWTLLGWLGFAIVGGVILHARPRNPIGWLMLAAGCYWPYFYGVLALLWSVDALPSWLEAVAQSAGGAAWLTLPFILVLFPGGRIESALGRVVTWGLAVAAAVYAVVTLVGSAPMALTGRVSPLAIPGAAVLSDAVLGSGIVVVLLLIAAAVVDEGLRWARSTGARRLQFRWLGFGGAVTLVALVGLIVSEGWPDVIALPLVLAINAIPVSIGVAITRHGLYQIGRVVSRTVSYAAVTVLAVGIYALVVTSVSWLLPGLPAIGVALATLAAAAAALPALRWAQRVLDRRFDRARYDAEEVVDAFGRRLRDGADPASTAPALADAVERALAPASLAVWTPPRSREAPDEP